MLDSSVVTRSSDSTGFSMDSMFGSVVKISVALVTSEYLMAVVEALHTVVTKFSQEEGRLLMSIIALSSSSIVVP